MKKKRERATILYLLYIYYYIYYYIYFYTKIWYILY